MLMPWAMATWRISRSSFLSTYLSSYARSLISYTNRFLTSSRAMMPDSQWVEGAPNSAVPGGYTQLFAGNGLSFSECFPDYIGVFSGVKRIPEKSHGRHPPE